MTQSSKANSRKVYLDLLRIIAIIFVIFNHTDAEGFFLFSEKTPDEFSFWSEMLLAVCCPVAVPLFFMISGALLLNRENESIKDLLIKRVLKIGVILIFWSLIYYLYDCFLNPYSDLQFDRHYFNITLYTSHLKYHLWYLYMYIAYLLSLPFLRALVKNLENKYFVAMIVLALIFVALIPTFEYLHWGSEYSINEFIKVGWLTGRNIVYPCIGYYIDKRIEKDKLGKCLPLIWIANFAGIFMSMFLTYRVGQQRGGEYFFWNSQTWIKAYVILNAIAVFSTVKWLCCRYTFSDGIAKIVNIFGECTFGIFLVHILVKDSPFMYRFLMKMRSSSIDNMLAAWIFVISTFLISFIISFVMNKIPIVRKLVGGK